MVYFAPLLLPSSKQQEQSGKPSPTGVSPPVAGTSQQGGKDSTAPPQPPSTPQPPPTPTPQPPATPGGSIPIAVTPTTDIKPSLPGETKVAEGKGVEVKEEPKTPGPSSAPTVGLNINTDKDESKVGGKIISTLPWGSGCIVRFVPRFLIMLDVVFFFFNVDLV